MTKIGTFFVGAACGVLAYNLVKTPAFKKACASVVSKGLQLKDEAKTFAESVKEDAEDILAEAKYLNEQQAKTTKGRL